MVETKNINYQKAVTMIQDRINSGNLTKITGNSLRSTLSRVLKVVYADHWDNIELDNIDVEQLLHDYTHKVEDKYKSRDLMITRSRIRRVFRIIRGDDESSQQWTHKPGRDSDFHDNTASSGFSSRDDKICLLDAYYHVLNSMCLDRLEKTVFNLAGAKHNNYYAIPAASDKIAGLSLPKNLTPTELETVHKLIDGIFICEIYQKKGGPD